MEFESHQKTNDYVIASKSASQQLVGSLVLILESEIQHNMFQTRTRIHRPFGRNWVMADFVIVSKRSSRQGTTIWQPSW